MLACLSLPLIYEELKQRVKFSKYEFILRCPNV